MSLQAASAQVKCTPGQNLTCSQLLLQMFQMVVLTKLRDSPPVRFRK